MNLLLMGAAIGSVLGIIIAFIYSLISTKGAPKSRQEALEGVRGKGPGCGRLILIILVFAILGAIGGIILSA